MIDGGIDGGGVEGAEGHDDVAIFVEVRAIECGFFLVGSVDGDLVISGFGVVADEMEMTAFAIVEAVEGIVTAGDRVKKGFGDGVQWSIIDTPAPDEVVNVVNMFLMRFRGKESFRKPCAAEKWADVLVAN